MLKVRLGEENGEEVSVSFMTFVCAVILGSSIVWFPALVKVILLALGF